MRFSRHLRILEKTNQDVYASSHDRTDLTSNALKEQQAEIAAQVQESAPKPLKEITQNCDARHPVRETVKFYKAVQLFIFRFLIRASTTFCIFQFASRSPS